MTKELINKIADAAHVWNDACNAREAVCSAWDVCGDTLEDPSGSAWHVREYEIALDKAIYDYNKHRRINHGFSC